MKKLVVLMFVMAATAVNAQVFHSYRNAADGTFDNILYILEHNEDPDCSTCLRNRKCTKHTIKLTKEEEITILTEYIREYHIGKIVYNICDVFFHKYEKKMEDIIQRLKFLTGNRSIDDEIYKEVKKECRHFLKLEGKIKRQQEILEKLLEKNRRRLDREPHKLIEECLKRVKDSKGAK